MHTQDSRKFSCRRFFIQTLIHELSERQGFADLYEQLATMEQDRKEALERVRKTPAVCKQRAEAPLFPIGGPPPKNADGYDLHVQIWILSRRGHEFSKRRIRFTSGLASETRFASVDCTPGFVSGNVGDR